MKVKELKQALEKVDENAEVYIEMPNEIEELNYYEMGEIENLITENCIHLCPVYENNEE